jgi:hypothetical protein
VVASVSQLIRNLASQESLLTDHGVTPDEYRRALPAAIQAIRGSMSADNADRRRFLENVFTAMQATGAIAEVTHPKYGEETVYRLEVPGLGAVAVIQKGCPDGRHNANWTIPDWAVETYLWWVCDSLSSHPGEHINKGVNRLRKRFDEGESGALDGVIFSSQMCGTPDRICPKSSRSVMVNGRMMPPPCIYTMPDWAAGAEEWNWRGTAARAFPSVLLGFYGIDANEADAYTGYVGFQTRGSKTQTLIASRSGLGRSSKHRS